MAAKLAIARAGVKLGRLERMEGSPGATWLEAFTEPRLIRRGPLLRLYGCRDRASDAPRVVVVAAATDAIRARRTLDALAGAHGRLDHPLIPKVATRASAGEIEYLAFDCDAFADGEHFWEGLAASAREHLRYDAFMRAGLELIRAFAHAHERGVCLGPMSWSSFLFSPSGKAWLWGFGAHAGEPIPPGMTVAPELGPGVMPTPSSDVFQTFFLVGNVKARVVMPERVMAGAAGDDEARAWFEVVTRALSPRPSDRPASLAEVIPAMQRFADSLDAGSGSESFQAVASRVLGASRDRSAPTVPARVRRQPGEYLRERYRLDGLLGEGGMGAVSLAWDRQLRQRVTVKTLHADAPGLRERFVREVRILRSVVHPNLVRGFDLIEEEGHLHAVLEYVEGTPWSDWVARPWTNPAPLLLRGAELAAGLAALHAASIVHRDVKPANIVVNDARGAVLLDFGVALEGQSDLTATGALIGTLRYMAPEQRRGEPVNERCDIYALALVLVEALAGRRLTDAAFQAEQLPSLLAAPAAAGVRPLLERCLAESPESRPAAYELAASLARASSAV
jgi:hypothetical protein